MTLFQLSVGCVFIFLLVIIPFVQAFLDNDDLGDSVDGVEALLKKHEDFEKSLSAQEEKVNTLSDFANQLIDTQPPHYATDDITKRRDAVSIV